MKEQESFVDVNIIKQQGIINNKRNTILYFMWPKKRTRIKEKPKL